jgi:allantoin racemase
MRLLVINPNTSAAISRRLQEHVAGVVAGLATGVEVRSATAAFGANYISDEASFAIAAHAGLDAAASDCALHGDPDAILLGCFGDPGIEALRETIGRPVVGLAEAAMREAASHGRFAVVTGGAAWRPMLERLARSLGWGEALVAVHVLEATGAQLAADPDAAIASLRAACRTASAGADAVILGGAGLAGMAAQIAPAVDVPLIDSVTAGARALLGAAQAGAPTSLSRTTSAPTEWQGLSVPLLQRLR